MDRPLSERSQRILGLARDEASRLHHEYIGTEHILLGIASESAGITSEALSSLGVTRDGIRSAVQSIVGVGPTSASPDDRGLTPRARRVIEFAHEEAAQRGVPSVKPAHLLLGITREPQGVASQVLRNLHVSPESVHGEVSRLLGQGDDEGPNA
jgi:ATP-dependent Clp protease ATP-binding subunit ClpC